MDCSFNVESGETKLEINVDGTVPSLLKMPFEFFISDKSEWLNFVHRLINWFDYVVNTKIQ